MTMGCVTVSDIPSDSALLITHADTSKRTFCESQRISNVLTCIVQSGGGSILPMIRGLASHGEAYSPAVVSNPLFMSCFVNHSSSSDGKHTPAADTVIFSTMIHNVIESISDRLSDTTEENMDIMKRNNDSIDWQSKPFCRTNKLKGKSSDSIEEYTEQGATRLYDELVSTHNGELSDVRTSWFDDVQGVGYDATSLYFIEIGPTVATAPGVTWNSAFSMTEEAPEFKSEAWKDIASNFNFSARDEREGIPSKVLSMYNALEKLTDRNDCHRAVHPKELRTHGPHVGDRAFEIATDSLATFKGVRGPTDGPAWTYTDPEAVATDSTTEATETEETVA